MDLVSLVPTVLPFAFGAGINLYATVAVVGLAARAHVLTLPGQFAGFDSPWVIGIALALYLVEFVADKVPWVDTAWDAVHTVVRPLGGALVAMGAVGVVPPEWQVGAALLGGSVALTTHLTKAGTRAVVNASPEPFSNWVLSLAEDAFVVALTWVAVEHPVFAALVAAGLLLAIALFASVLLKALQRRVRG